MKYINLIKTDKFLSKFAYFFLALFVFTGIACESNNDDNPLETSTMKGYLADTNYWFSNTPKVRSYGRDSVGKDTILTIEGVSGIDGSSIYMFIPSPDIGSFSVEAADSTDSTNRPRMIVRYQGQEVPTGTINITRFDTVRYILEADFNFGFTGFVESDSGTIDTTSIEFTKGKIKAAYLRRRD